MQETMSKRVRSGIVELGTLVFAIHLWTSLLYGFAASPAFLAKYGSMTGLQLNLWTAAVSLPAAVFVAFLERRLKRRLIVYAMGLVTAVWLIALIYVFHFIPEGIVTLDPSKESAAQ